MRYKNQLKPYWVIWWETAKIKVRRRKVPNTLCKFLRAKARVKARAY